MEQILERILGKILTALIAAITAITMCSGKVFVNKCVAAEPDAECLIETSESVDDNKGVSWSFDDGIVVKFGDNKARVTYEKTSFLKKVAVNVCRFLVSGLSFAVLAKNIPLFQKIVDKCDDGFKSAFGSLWTALKKGCSIEISYKRHVYTEHN